VSNNSFRIRREKQTIAAMTQIYCRAHHGSRETLCSDCAELLDYARRRLDSCPFGERKPACNRCLVHCYSTRNQERIKQIMRFAGPRMLYHHPLLSLMHLLDKLHAPPSLKKRG